MYFGVRNAVNRGFLLISKRVKAQISETNQGGG